MAATKFFSTLKPAPHDSRDIREMRENAKTCFLARKMDALRKSSTHVSRFALFSLR